MGFPGQEGRVTACIRPTRAFGQPKQRPARAGSSSRAAAPASATRRARSVLRSEEVRTWPVDGGSSPIRLNSAENKRCASGTVTDSPRASIEGRYEDPIPPLVASLLTTVTPCFASTSQNYFALAARSSRQAPCWRFSLRFAGRSSLRSTDLREKAEPGQPVMVNQFTNTDTPEEFGQYVNCYG